MHTHAFILTGGFCVSHLSVMERLENDEHKCRSTFDPGGSQVGMKKVYNHFSYITK